jgi:hypothetical protein
MSFCYNFIIILCKLSNYSFFSLFRIPTMHLLKIALFVHQFCLTSFIVCVLGYCCISCSCCIFFVFAVVVKRICFVFIVVGCPLLLCFVYCVLIECVVTSCNVCYLSVVSLLYYCHRAKTQSQSNK